MVAQWSGLRCTAHTAMAVIASCDTGAESRRTDTNRRGRDMALTSRRGRPCPATRSAAHVVVAPVGFLQRGLVAVVQDADQSPAAMLARAGLKEHGRDPIAHRLLVAVLEGPVAIGAGFGYRRVVRATGRTLRSAGRRTSGLHAGVVEPAVDHRQGGQQFLPGRVLAPQSRGWSGMRKKTNTPLGQLPRRRGRPWTVSG
jgi:hypothetical protein